MLNNLLKNKAIAHISALVTKYKYRKLSKKLSLESRQLYTESLPDWCQMNGETLNLITIDNTLMATAYDRVVIGDYGAFLEFSREQLIKSNIRCKSGEEYRFESDAYKDKVKYFWYTAKDISQVKIYFQQKTVTYADYLPNKFYISPFELKVMRTYE